MSEQNSIKVPGEISEYFWTRYLPETTYKVYMLIAYLNKKKAILDAQIEIENNIPRVIQEKKDILNKLGFKYPENRQEDIDLLLKYNLIEMSKDEDGEDIYVHVYPIKRPQEVLDIDKEELKTLENIKFELEHEQALNMLFTLILNNNGKLTCSVDHIIKTTKVKLTEVKEVMNYLLNEEGSIKVIANKDIKKLKKDDKVYITLDEEVFNQKRFMI